MKRTSLIAGALVLALAMVFVSTSSDGLASHYTYMQENPTYRTAFSDVFPFNAVAAAWHAGPYDVDWDDDGSFTGHIQNAIGTWEAAVPQLDFHKTTDGWNYLLFEDSVCPNPQYACFAVDEQYIDYTRRADYLLWATIIMDNSLSGLTDMGKEDILRHEIGHWIGLDEAYNEAGSCSTINSVMNGVFTNGESCVGAHAPTQRDINAVTEYWNGDKPESAVLTERPNTILKLTWTDALWSESTNWVGLFYWDDDTDAVVLADQSWVTADTGFHKDSISRTIQKQWNVQANGWPTDAWYFAAVMGWSWPWQSYGPLAWSNLVDMN